MNKITLLSRWFLSVLLCGLLSGAAFSAPKDDGWPQYRGGPDRNNYRKVKDKIEVPRVLWKADFAHVPAAVDKDVYAGGAALRKIDLETGEVKASWKPEGAEDRMFFFCTPVVLEDRV